MEPETVRHWSLSWARWIKSITYHSTSLRSILILSSHPCPRLPNGLLASGFPTTILYPFPMVPMRSTCSNNLILFDLISVIIFDEAYKLWNTSLYTVYRVLLLSLTYEVSYRYRGFAICLKKAWRMCVKCVD